MAEKTNTQEIVVQCVDCGDEITLTGKVTIGQEIACPECGTWMEVVALDPAEVDWIYDEPEYDEEQEDE